MDATLPRLRIILRRHILQTVLYFVMVYSNYHLCLPTVTVLLVGQPRCLPFPVEPSARPGLCLSCVKSFIENAQ
jgi:hypothetical protein